MADINLKINGMDCKAPAGSTILQAAKYNGIEIPTLCYLKDINEIGACRICVVEVKGARSLVASCVYPINEGMEVWTNTPKVLKSRKKTLQIITRAVFHAYVQAAVSFRSSASSMVLRTRTFTQVL